jgi:pSer/pThr/pTyr-binding forkhead associated (FHA) protein
MQVTLLVVAEGKWKGKTIPVRPIPFLIGRGAKCHLRPASPVVSKSHCAIVIRDNKVFVQDLESTNGTFINDRQIKGEVEVKNEDCLTIGPLAFALRIQTLPPVNLPTPPPPSKPGPDTAEDEAAAAMLLSSLPDSPPEGSPGVDSAGIPTGSTVMELPSTALNAPQEADESKKPLKKEGDTSAAAKSILDKYWRRDRR